MVPLCPLLSQWQIPHIHGRQHLLKILYRILSLLLLPPQQRNSFPMFWLDILFFRLHSEQKQKSATFNTVTSSSASINKTHKQSSNKSSPRPLFIHYFKNFCFLDTKNAILSYFVCIFFESTMFFISPFTTLPNHP